MYLFSFIYKGYKPLVSNYLCVYSIRRTRLTSTSIMGTSDWVADNWIASYATTSGMWTINEMTAATGHTLVVNTAGVIAANGIQYTSSAYPVVYLDEATGFTSGEGTEGNPYKLKSGNTPVVPTTYKDYISDVYINSWGNSLSGFAGKEINSFDKEGGALLFANETWGISSQYMIDQATIYSYNGIELTTFYQRTWIDDSSYHSRLSNYVFKRQINPDLGYIGGESILEQNNGTLRFVIIVK